MKKIIRTLLLPLFLITSAQAQNHHQLDTSEIPMVYSNSVRLAGGTISPTGYAARFMAVTRKDELTWIFDHNKVAPGDFKLVLSFPIAVFRVNKNTEMAIAATADKQLILFRYWF